MHIKLFRVQNFRRLKDVRVDLESKTSIFVGANNSGKTSATHVFQLFLGKSKGDFSIYDFTADCWSIFNRFDPAAQDTNDLPAIVFDLWFDVDDENVHRVIDLLPNLEWEGTPVGVRLSYAPKDGQKLMDNYADACAKAKLPSSEAKSTYRPWPRDLTDYLTKRLRSEYEIKYYILDFAQFDADLYPNPGYEPYPLGTTASTGAKVVDSLVQVDFLDAQRHLSDTESRGRAEDLSKRLSRFYTRNLKKRDDDFEALQALADSEARLNAHFADVFAPTLKSLSELGYPGITNLNLVIKSTFNAEGILNSSARVHYALPRTTADAADAASLTLPDQYNGLGFKNLIYMVVEILDFHYAWAGLEDSRPPVHLVMIEEPETHLHAQLQQVFIRKMLDILPEPIPGFQTQMIVTTHSAHILYESTFKPIRYFRRADHADAVHHTDVKNLSTFYHNEEVATRDFLLQYLKLTHCDLFFADAAILVEGNVERLLLPLMIQKAYPELRACHLTILEVGGAFAHKFKQLIEFLDLTTLIITDLDSVHGSGADLTEAPESDDDDGVASTACMADVVGAVTSNETLKQWTPKVELVSELLALGGADKSPLDDHGNPARVRVAFETAQSVCWNGTSSEIAGRTFEEAFVLQNLTWCQDPSRKHLGFGIARATELDLTELKAKIFRRVKTFDKTRFALGLIGENVDAWTVPIYIVEGLEWLQQELGVIRTDPVADLEPEVTG
jgi:predicted ATP-dependent endonuclease of OLD family